MLVIRRAKVHYYFILMYFAIVFFDDWRSRIAKFFSE